jgi:5,5'-dehydrodivanillate O-demethylase
VLTKEENELLTRVGPGTPCGELLRRYWHPIAPTVQLDENPVRKVRILCEDLVLYRDRQGRLGLIGERCPHRGVHMQFGIPEQEGLRCPYHGWMYNAEGRCIEQPLEPPDSTFKDRIRIKAYPVQELGGLVWAYLGPEPVPLLPRWDLLVKERCFRQIFTTMLPCNWLQVMENRADPAHGPYTHGRLFQYALERQGRLPTDPMHRANASLRTAPVKYGIKWNQYGFTKRSLSAGQDEATNLTWQKGTNPVLFPYTLRLGFANQIRNQLQIGVPIDDTHTWHLHYACYVLPEGVEPPPQAAIPYVEVPYQDEQGEYILDFNSSQDWVSWYAQGEITDRTQEHLGFTDSIVIAFRRFFKEQIEVVQGGGEPINVFREPSENQCIEFDLAPSRNPDTLHYRQNYHKGTYIYDDLERFAPDREIIAELIGQAAELAEGKAS